MFWLKKSGKPGAVGLRAFPTRDKRAADAVQAQLAKRLSLKPSQEINFGMTHSSTICCFDGKTLYLTDCNLRPVLTYESSSYIHACAISDTGRYIVCQTANSREGDTESGVMILFDVTKKAEIARSKIPTGWKGMTHLFVDENAKRIFVYYGSSKVDYDFSLQPNDAALESFMRAQRTDPKASPYELNGRAQELIANAKAGSEDWNAVENEVLSILQRIGANAKMSRYQLSLTYRELGDLYAERGDHAKAASAYEEGLSLNPNLPVKKKLKQEREKAAGQ